MEQELDPRKLKIAVVGLGLMGCSITTCLLLAGHPVIAIAPIASDMQTALPRIRHHLERSRKQGLVNESPEFYLKNLLISEDYSELSSAMLVIECTLENMDIKKAVYEKIEAVVGADTLITSNTSALPISMLQSVTKIPDRFFGLHWAEPSHTTRFLEIICGDRSDPIRGEQLYQLSHLWGKEPTLVRKDIRGFIGNRLMYAMYREAFDLVEKGYATVEDVDRACRNNTGYWMTLVGVFRWMDLTGVPAYHTVLKDLWPTLSNRTDVPELIDKIVREGGKGTANAHGFYEYSPEEAKLWEETFTNFSYEIRELALKYPADVVKRKLNKGNSGT